MGAINLFDYFEEVPLQAGEPVRWAAWAPRRPNSRFDLKLVPRSEGWREDPDSLEVLERIEAEPWVNTVARTSKGVYVRLDDDWIEATGGAVRAGEAPLADLAHGRRFAVQFWDANATKALHVGHLRNLAIGNALAASFAQAGAEVERRSLISDVGRSMGEAMAGVAQQPPARALLAGRGREKRPFRRPLLRGVRRRLRIVHRRRDRAPRRLDRRASWRPRGHRRRTAEAVLAGEARRSSCGTRRAPG